ncbi:MAG: hypothetical protein PHF18_04050 [Methanosarcina sp.]|uniref:hypothetical protein n=1 Tax=Methanosarcina sp. TaxID=2213 RepID=UPI00261141E9|nr:hypothetical protein [Methanosarcina sp.]MDD3246022.1 hypothetical protein [Methanosarcina sp.]MDD4249309.1 hypothetical protein [Methanosarcina sp.]
MTATGIYHKHNFLKLRILSEFFAVYPQAMTSNELCEAIGNPASVRSMLAKYKKYRLIKRMPKKAPGHGGCYRYKLTNHGARYYFAYKHRYNLGFDLNQLRHTPKRVDCYFGLTKYGVEVLGLTEDDLLPEEEGEDPEVTVAI